eukprot:6205595-Pleurochrysis_carterae.AAC.6
MSSVSAGMEAPTVQVRQGDSNIHLLRELHTFWISGLKIVHSGIEHADDMRMIRKGCGNVLLLGHGCETAGEGHGRREQERARAQILARHPLNSNYNNLGTCEPRRFATDIGNKEPNQVPRNLSI